MFRKIWGTVVILLLWVGSLYPQSTVITGGDTLFPETEPVSIEEVQVAEHVSWYPTQNMQQGPSQDSLIKYAVSLLAELSTTPAISNFNENNVKFVYEDSVLTEEVVKVLSEALHAMQLADINITEKITDEIGAKLQEVVETLVRVKRREAKAYLVWPVLIVLSLVPLLLGISSERRVLQYLGVSLLVASLIGFAVHLPDILALSALPSI